jgi:DNA-binding Lrp family transcriptional regulator
MPKAYVLINVESGAEESVINELRSISGVEESYYSYGVNDLITKENAETLETLKEMVTKKIRILNRVRSTLTQIMMEE